MADWQEQEQPSRRPNLSAPRDGGLAGSLALRTATRALTVGAAGARRWSLGVGALEALNLDGCRPAASPRGWNLELRRMAIWRRRRACARGVRAPGGVPCAGVRLPVRQSSRRHTTVGFDWWAWAGRVNSGSWAIEISGMGCSGTGWRYPNYPELVRVSQVSTRNYQINFGYPVLRVRVRVFRVRVMGNGFFAQS
jgi:hypothetical protein